MWENFEEYVKTLLVLDKAMTVPGSGNGKSEEDVIGLSTITQCKYSEKDKSSISILKKDILRLNEAAKLQNKTPLFFTRDANTTVLSIQDSPELLDIISFIVAISQYNYVLNNKDHEQNKTSIRMIEKRVIPIFETLLNKYIKKCKNLLDVLNLPFQEIQTDLFKQEG